MDNEANISDVIQLLRFSGEALSFGIKAIGGTGKALKKGKDLGNLAVMQGKLAVYHTKAATETKYNLLSLKTMQKITGGNYGVVDIPTEDPKKLAKFFNAMKKMKIQGALLPDLVPNNGYSQIAINPQQAQRLEALIRMYDFSKDKVLKKDEPKESDKAKIISFSDYWNEGNPEEKEQIVAEATENLEKERKDNPQKKNEMTRESKEELKNAMKIEEFRQKSLDKDNFYQVTIDKKMIVRESEEAYLTRVPNSFDKETNSSMMMAVKKSDSLMVNNGKTIITFIPKEGQTCVARNDKGGKVEKKMMKNRELYGKHYCKYDTDLNKKARNQRNKQKLQGTNKPVKTGAQIIKFKK